MSAHLGTGPTYLLNCVTKFHCMDGCSGRVNLLLKVDVNLDKALLCFYLSSLGYVDLYI